MKKQEHTSTFLAELGVSPSPRDGLDSKQSPSASKTDSVSESLNDTGPECLASMTSMTSMEETIGESPSLQEDFLASHSVRPGSEEARRMTARSGRKWLELYRRQDQLGCLVRTLLASSRWASTKCFLTWQAWDTPAKRSLFQLLPSMPRTEETECGLWPTPTVSDTEGGIIKNVELHKGSFSRKNKQGVRWGVKLKDAVSHQEKEEDGGQLAPAFVEWLMGYPTGWTDLRD